MLISTTNIFRLLTLPLFALIYRYLIFNIEKNNKTTNEDNLVWKIGWIFISNFMMFYSVALLKAYWIFVILNKEIILDIWIFILMIFLSFLSYFFFLNIFSKKELVIIFIIQGIVLIIFLVLAFRFGIVCPNIICPVEYYI